jgi:hypothetical protein
LDFLIKSRQKNLNLDLNVDFHSRASRIFRQLLLIYALGRKLPESSDFQCLAKENCQENLPLSLLPTLHLTFFLYAAVTSDIKNDKCFMIKMASVINHDYNEKNWFSKENYCSHLKYLKFF